MCIQWIYTYKTEIFIWNIVNADIYWYRKWFRNENFEFWAVPDLHFTTFKTKDTGLGCYLISVHRIVTSSDNLTESQISIKYVQFVVKVVMFSLLFPFQWHFQLKVFCLQPVNDMTACEKDEGVLYILASCHGWNPVSG